jgi:hypothetical protein
MSLSKSLSTNSTQSFDSFASDDDESAESTPKTYDMAPWDIFTEHPMVGKVCVATKGEVVPKETRYLAKKGVYIGVKFRYCIFQDFLRIYLFSVLMNILL